MITYKSILISYLEDIELQIIRLIRCPQNRMVRGLGTVFHLTQAFMNILCCLPNGLGEQLICHEVRAGACCQKTAVFQQFHGTQVDFPIAFGGVFHGASGFCESGRVQDDDVEFLAFFFQFRQEREYVTALETYSIFQSVQFGVSVA